MGRKPLNRVRCPRCKLIGTLRLKQGYSIVVSHYDRSKAKSGRGKGMKHHYIGSLRYDIDKIVKPYQDQLSETNFSWFKVTLRRLKDRFTEKVPSKIAGEYEVSKFIELMNELRILRKGNNIKIEKQWLQWYAHCDKCQQPFLMYATFTGVQSKQRVYLHYLAVAESPNRVYMQTEPRKIK
jgi:hypothetical protein